MQWGTDARAQEAVCVGPEWLTAPDAAKLARMDIDTLRLYRQRGDIVGYNGMTGAAFGTASVLGGYLLRFKRSDVIDLAQTVHPWLLVALPSGWRERARCRDLSPEQENRIFFPEMGESYDEALSYCRACPVRQDCLDWATMVGCEAGMFGGATGPELIRFNHHWRKTGKLPVAGCANCGRTYSNDTDYCSTTCAIADGSPETPAIEPTKSQYPGVTREPRTQRWRARYGKHNKALGYFDTEEEARVAHDEYAAAQRA